MVYGLDSSIVYFSSLDLWARIIFLDRDQLKRVMVKPLPGFFFVEGIEDPNVTINL